MSTDLELAAPQVSFLPSEHEAGRVWSLVTRIQNTEFVPKGLRGKPEAIMAAMLTGREIGIGPMHALRGIDVIDGKPSLSAELMASLVLRAGHLMWVVESTSTSCTIAGRRAEWPDRIPDQEVTWSMEDAKQAGLLGKGNWQKYPRAMLRARATSELCRSVFADVVERVGYVAEELGSEEPPDHQAQLDVVREVAPETADVVDATFADDEPPVPPAPAAAAREGEDVAEVVEYEDWTVEQLKERLRELDLPVGGTKAEKIARLREVETADDGADAEVVDAEVVDEPEQPPAGMSDDPGTITKGQIQKLAILCRELGIRDGGDDTLYRAALNATYGVDSSKDLSEKQASGLIRVLENGRTLPGGDHEPPEQVAAAWLQKGDAWLAERERLGLRGRMFRAMQTIGSEHEAYPELYERMVGLVEDPSDESAWDRADQEQVEALVVETERHAAEVDR